MDEADDLISRIVAELQQIDGVAAIVLGGSRSRGTHTQASDIDIGLYYDPEHPLDLRALSQLATRLDHSHRENLITNFGGWGPWINGGGWLQIGDFAVDLLYRDMSKVEQVITDCLAGRIEMAYQPGHPHGFPSYIYTGEVAICRPLWDAPGTLTALKSQTTPYPPKLRRAIIEKFFWEVDFSLAAASKSISRIDVSYAAGCLYRAVACLLQTLFALNGVYWLNEKGALAYADQFPARPSYLLARVERAFSELDADPDAIKRAISVLSDLREETAALITELA